MRFALLPLALLLLATTTLAGTYYKWVDKNGVTHYSDRPVPGAVIVDTGPSQPSRPPPSPPAPASGQPSTTGNAPNFQYRKVDLWSPSPDQTFTNASNTVTVRVRVEPTLRPTDSIWIYLDGVRVDGLPGSGEEFQLNEVWRGTHNVAAVVADGDGKVVMRSQTVTFHMQQTGLLSPGSRVNKAKPPSAGN